MKRLPEKLLRTASVTWLVCSALTATGQELWKYTDKDGKVTYSDKAPKQGEKAERVVADTTGTVIPASKNTVGGAAQSSATVSARAAEREALREIYRKGVDSAREELEQARKALEAGREPTEAERQILVGRGKDGKPSGSNALARKPEYYERIAALEAEVKKAEEKVANAERNFRDNAPK
jgi:phage shock protein A